MTGCQVVITETITKRSSLSNFINIMTALLIILAVIYFCLLIYKVYKDIKKILKGEDENGINN